MITETAYAAVRKAEGREYIDLTSISCLPEISREKAEKTDSEIPSWAAANKIQRIVNITITEGLPTGR